MKNTSYFKFATIITFCIISLCGALTDCKKSENPVKFAKGTFPDTVINLALVNSEYDDYNLTLYQISYLTPIIFSSNRKSSGGQFDLEQASMSFTFDQTDGTFTMSAVMTNDPYFNRLINAAKTTGDDFGPYSLFSRQDGYEYFMITSENGQGNLDLFYLRNQPTYGSGLPDIEGPHPIKLLNTGYDDGYICFDSNFDTAYFISNRDGDFDIFLQKRPEEKDIASWFNLEVTSSTRLDSINSPGEDKCPDVLRNLMVFSSDRSGGLGGFDLYYSVFRKGKWSSPLNFGPAINTPSNEYRPLIRHHPDFENLYLMFSSDRPGGKGGFDLYFTGVEIPE